MSPEPQRKLSVVQTPQEEKKPAEKRRSKWLLIAAILVVVLGLGGGAAWYLIGARATKNNDTLVEAGTPKSLTLDSFTVNLAEPGYRRYLRVTVTLEYTGKDLEKEIAGKDYRVRDAIINVLRSKTVADINNQDRTLELRQELVEAINLVLVNSQVKNIYFRDFIIQ
ncbi:hypothetical protein SY88_04060 [Clostridiales bacterium PH28_bin88]|nr:hypothetical protein SY88_04060 [Clostridiales bacterium PH28_bin88]